MRTLAILLGTVAAVAFGAAVSADPAGVKVAQGHDSATHSGGVTQSRAAGNRESGAGARSSESSSSHSATNAGSRTSSMGTRGSDTSRTTVRTEGSGRISARERSETTGVSVRSGGRHAVGVRATDNDDDDVVIRRKRARQYVDTEPSARVIHKRKRVEYNTYDEPSSATVIHRRRAGVAIEEGESARSGVRSRTSTRTSVGTSGTTRTNVGRRASEQGTHPLTEGRAGQSGSAKASGGTTARSAPGGSESKSTGARQ